jgi:hypothetical protein
VRAGYESVEVDMHEYVRGEGPGTENNVYRETRVCREFLEVGSVAVALPL